VAVSLDGHFEWRSFSGGGGWIPTWSALRGATPLVLDARHDVRGLVVMSSSTAFEPGIIGSASPATMLFC
jgi:hypothetical protein